MPRGRGRGGGRGRPRPGTARIGGVDIAFEDDVRVSDRPQPAPLFPPYKLTLLRPLSAIEKLQIARQRALRESIHQGPLYTTLGSAPMITKPGQRSAAVDLDPFEGIETYSQRYLRKRRKIPKLDTRPYVLRFFPKELWSTLDPLRNMTNGAGKPKTLILSTATKPSKLDALNEGNGEGRDAIEENEEEAEADEKDPSAEDDEVPEEEVDDDYDEDEEDMAGDYNAEAYFEDGGDDGGDDYDEGGGGEGVF